MVGFLGRQECGGRRGRRRLTAAATLAGLLMFGGCAAASSSASRAVERSAAAVPGIVDIETNVDLPGAAGAGTGMVLRGSGVVLTNNHVIRGATAIRVTDLDNGRTYRASIVGYDASADIAVLQLKSASGLKTIPLGDSSTLKVGDAVTALGNAGGVGGHPSSATGTITALGRSLAAGDENGASEQLSGLIETSAPLEPGDSGGPLLDSAGKAIGMDTAASASLFFQPQATQGYAIPINTATAIAAAIEDGDASSTVHVGPTAFLGVSIEPFSYLDGTQLMPGALVLGVVPASPVERAGVSFGDVITSLDGHTITSPALLGSLLLGKNPGETVRLRWVSPLGTGHSSTIRLAAGPPQ